MELHMKYIMLYTSSFKGSNVPFANLTGSWSIHVFLLQTPQKQIREDSHVEERFCSHSLEMKHQGSK